uniref:Uncharacterized protein n=1 Tax=Lepeophtheirus salmonis TaxID=72036 RepID=A0A0K2VJL6_LEPSM
MNGHFNIKLDTNRDFTNPNGNTNARTKKILCSINKSYNLHEASETVKMIAILSCLLKNPSYQRPQELTYFYSWVLKSNLLCHIKYSIPKYPNIIDCTLILI